MSYEGYEETLCARGHFSTHDCYEDRPVKCWFCDGPITHAHSVDCTNGPDDDFPATVPAPKEKIGVDDDWRVDHHGNRYSSAVPCYRPVAEWREIRQSE